jgi:toxin FitB
MSWLIDTNVVSKWVKPTPDRGVIEWLHEADEDRLYLSVVTIAEVRDGIERLPAGRRRANLTHWLDSELPARLEGRLLPIDAAVADEAGCVLARVRASGREP